MIADSTKPTINDLQGFTSFYDQYAPKLWGLILSADLGASASKTILVRTFMNAWHHPHRQVIGEHQLLTFLLSLAYTEGLPPGTLKSVFGRS
ncbi:hypothetical protein [Spirosoma arcticum]